MVAGDGNPRRGTCRDFFQIHCLSSFLCLLNYKLSQTMPSPYQFRNTVPVLLSSFETRTPHCRPGCIFRLLCSLPTGQHDCEHTAMHLLSSRLTITAAFHAMGDDLEEGSAEGSHARAGAETESREKALPLLSGLLGSRQVSAAGLPQAQRAQRGRVWRQRHPQVARASAPLLQRMPHRCRQIRHQPLLVQHS